MNHIAANTNQYAKIQRDVLQRAHSGREWHATTNHELYIWVSLLI
jgi:hypothetical protein